jgi:hypothetical protein
MTLFFEALKRHPITQHRGLLNKLIELAEQSKQVEYKSTGLFGGKTKLASFITPPQIQKLALANGVPLSLDEAEVYAFAASKLIDYDMGTTGFGDATQKAVERAKKYGSAILVSDLDLKALFRCVYPNERTMWADTARHL